MVTPPLNVFAPPNTNPLEPVFTSAPPALEITPLITNPVGAKPPTEIVRDAACKSTAELIVGTVAVLSFVTFNAPVNVSVPAVTVGPAVPPWFTRFNVANAFAPLRVNVEPPFNVTVAVLLIWFCADNVTAALFTTNAPGTATVVVAFAPAVFNVNVPWFTYVVPE
jgi:hypothetical protein